MSLKKLEDHIVIDVTEEDSEVTIRGSLALNMTLTYTLEEIPTDINSEKFKAIQINRIKLEILTKLKEDMNGPDSDKIV